MLSPMRKGMLATTAASALLAVAVMPGAGASMQGHDGHQWRHHRHHHHLALTDAQRACLAGQGITLPSASTPHDPTKPKPDAAAFEAFRVAFVNCGIVPARVDPPTPPPTVGPDVSSFRTQAAPNGDDHDGSRWGGDHRGWSGHDGHDAHDGRGNFGGGHGFGGGGGSGGR
jgi:hypothetical protein